MNKPNRRTIIACLAFLSVAIPTLADDQQLQKALALANSGRTSEAISAFEELRASSPNDGRVLKSLGLIYQSAGRYDDAISALEAAGGVGAGSSDTDYALGLLYESKFVQTGSDLFRQKALAFWQRVSTRSSDPSQIAVANRHLRSLSEQP